MRNTTDILRFLTAGNARCTLTSKKSGARYTFRVRAADGSPGMFFVSVLSGPDNTRDYDYAGLLRVTDGTLVTHRTKASRVGEDAPSWKAWGWFVKQLATRAALPECLEFHHAGRCGRCGRALTVPASIESGLGPECAKKAAA